MGENRYIILPTIGFKSSEMEAFARGGDKGRGRRGAVTTSAAPARAGERVIDLKVVDVVAEGGPKAVEMSTADAQEFRRHSQYRLVPVRKYHPARRPRIAISRKALFQFWKGKAKEQIKVFVKEQGTGLPLPNVEIKAIVDQVTWAGLSRRTGAQGFATLTYPQGRRIQQLVIYPPPGFWGKRLENPPLSDGFEIFLTPFAPDYPDLLRRTYQTPRVNHAKGSGRGVKVAVIDTGIAKHPDLRLRFETNCVSGEDPKDVSVTDGHGTHVAGIIAGKRHGIAPDVELYSFKVFPTAGPGQNLYIARAIDQAVDAGCDLINLSLTSNRPDELLSEAIGHAFEHGCVCVVAAGNATRRPVAYPAWFKRSLAVSAIGKVGTFPVDAVEALDITRDRSLNDPDVFFAGFSNHGREIDLCAPGVGIGSTWLGGGYAVESGTSMACPVVTGVGAVLISGDKMLLSKKPEDRTLARSIEIVRRIQGSCEAVGFDEQSYEGFGWPYLR